MKKLFSFFAAALMAVGLMAETSTWTMNTTDGIKEITVNKQGTTSTGGDMELTKDGITATSSLAYFAGSGTNGIQIYKTGTLTITAPAGNNITSIVFQYPKDCYPFAEALNEDGSATTKTPAQVDVTWTAETPANSFTFTNVAIGQTKVKKMVITYEEGTTPGPTNETVYYVNTNEWDAVNAYAWKGGVNNGWPGVEATAEEAINGWEVYSFTAAAGTYENVIFNNGNGMQTSNLDWTAGKYYFNDAWVDAEDITEKPAVLLPTVKLAGDFTKWAENAPEFVPAEDNLTATVTANLEAGDKEFKLIVGADWLGNNGTMERENCTDWVFTTVGGNCKLTADVAGEYIFTYTYETKALSVTYPEAPAAVPVVLTGAATDEAINITTESEGGWYGNVLNEYYYNMYAGMMDAATMVLSLADQNSVTELYTGNKSFNIAELTFNEEALTPGNYYFVAGGLVEDAESAYGFANNGDAIVVEFTVAAPLEPATWYGAVDFTTESDVTATVDYEITRNADKTLTVACTIENEAAVTGLVPQVNLAGFHNLVKVDGVWNYTTAETYTDGAEITVEFYMAYAGGAKGLPVAYTVGAANEKPVKPMTFMVVAGEETFTVTPSDPTKDYYIEVINGGYDDEMYVAYIDANIAELGAGLDYVTGEQTQSYEDDWYIDVTGDYVILVCDVNADHSARVGDVVIVPFTYTAAPIDIELTQEVQYQDYSAYEGPIMWGGIDEEYTYMVTVSYESATGAVGEFDLHTDYSGIRTMEGNLTILSGTVVVTEDAEGLHLDATVVCEEGTFHVTATLASCPFTKEDVTIACDTEKMTLAFESEDFQDYGEPSMEIGNVEITLGEETYHASLQETSAVDGTVSFTLSLGSCFGEMSGTLDEVVKVGDELTIVFKQMSVYNNFTMGGYETTFDGDWNEEFTVTVTAVTPSGVENAEVESLSKTIVNGELVIIKNGVQYNVLGARK